MFRGEDQFCLEDILLEVTGGHLSGRHTRWAVINYHLHFSGEMRAEILYGCVICAYNCVCLCADSFKK